MSASSVAAQITQDTTLDRLANGELEGKIVRSIPMSLKPDERVSWGCVAGNQVAREIRDSWHFSQPIVVLPATDFDALVEKAHTVFTGMEKDIDDTPSIAAATELEADFE